MCNAASQQSIKKWSEEDRPREKLLFKGRQSLSNAELLAILFRSGTNNQSAVALARTLLAYVGNDLENLSGLSISQYMKFKGIGEAKALSLGAALELGRRRKYSSKGNTTAIQSSKDVFDFYFPLLADEQREHFRILLLRRNNTIIKDFSVSSGGVTGALVDPRIIFKEAIEQLASAIILVHNHPSGNVKPSKEDIKLTDKLVEAGKLLEINILDHLIISDNQYFSFSDEGLM